jgi:hypothetical protein
VKAVYEYRVLTVPQIVTLVFEDSTASERSRFVSVSRRLKVLTDNGYLWRGKNTAQITDGKIPYLYRIDKKALDWLPQILGVDPGEVEYNPKERVIKPQGLNHLLRTNDVRMALSLDAKRRGYEILKWVDDLSLKRLHQGVVLNYSGTKNTIQKGGLVPDGYFFLATQGRGAHLFIEVDLATETVTASNPEAKDWTQKIQKYLHFYKSGIYKRMYKANYFSVLTVTTSDKRLQNLKQATENVGGKFAFWFTTLDDLTPQTAFTAPIWCVAGADEMTSLESKFRFVDS